MTVLINLYTNRLKQLRSDISSRIHSSKLKERILSFFPDMVAHKQGRNTVIVAREDIDTALSKACDHDADSDAVLLARAAKIIRKDVLAMKQWFDGSIGRKC